MLQGIRERAEIRTRKSRIDEYLAEFDFSEIRTIEVDASAEEVYAATKALTGNDISGIAGKVSPINGLPEKLRDAEDQIKEAMDLPLLDILFEKAVVRLVDLPGQEIVFGIVGEFWEDGSGHWPDIESPEEYQAFDDPSFGKVAVNLMIQPGRESESVLLSSELRTSVPDASKREQFSQYWPVVSVGSGFVRQQWLKAIKRRAESSGNE